MTSDKLYYYSKSANKYPGSGINEYVSDPNKYLELSKIVDWRRILSNFWTAPIDIDGFKYNTVEHFFQGNKISIADNKLGYSFCLNSGSELSKSSGNIAQKNRKMVHLSIDQLKHWDNIKNNIMYKALYGKFNQHPELKKLLFLTKDAELWHGAARTPASRQNILELIRAKLLVEELKITQISLSDIAEKISSNKIINFTIDEELQPIVGLNTQNKILKFNTHNNNVYIVKCFYDINTNTINPPID